jgi:uncharacterized membrane protein HdeD (DUF308 family)
LKHEELFMAQTIPTLTPRSGFTASILWGAVLVVLGVLAVGWPLVAAVAVESAIAYLIVFAGLVHIFLAFHAHGAGSTIWKLLVGLAYVGFGGYLIFRPLLGVASLTLLLAALFVIEGVLDLVLYSRTRSLHGSSWVLIDGIITLLLGVMIYMQWPSSAMWAIGLLVGISMMISGITRIAMSLAIRNAESITASTKLAA